MYGFQNKFILIYMAKPSYGGWISFTAHLALKKSYKLYKLSDKKTEKHFDNEFLFLESIIIISWLLKYRHKI